MWLPRAGNGRAYLRALQPHGKVGIDFHAETQGPIPVSRDRSYGCVDLLQGTVGDLGRDLLLDDVNTRRSREGTEPQPEDESLVNTRCFKCGGE